MHHSTLVEGINSEGLARTETFALAGDPKTTPLQTWRVAVRKRVALFADLSKSGIVNMVLVTFGVGYILGQFDHGTDRFSALNLLWGLIGTALSAAGAGAFNCYIERDFDKLMRRTMKRPLPSLRLRPIEALLFAVLTSVLGLLLLHAGTNSVTALLSFLSLFTYVCVYTPLKRITWWNTSIGAIPGALPALGGWTAATGSVGALGLALFLLLFVWQHPHFYSLAWLYREDYERAGFAMLPVVDGSGRRTFRHILVYSILLVPVSIVPVLLGSSGLCYYYGALLLGSGLLSLSIVSALTQGTQHARMLFRATLLYFPLLLLLVLVDVSFSLMAAS